MDVLIIGATGGIGQALVKTLCARHPDWQVHATFRDSKKFRDGQISRDGKTSRDVQKPQPNFSGLESRVSWHPLDVSNEAQIAQLASTLPSLDWIINAVGLLHNDTHKPEKKLASIDGAFFLHNMEINTLPTLLLAKHFTPLFKRRAAPKLATISAKVGSINDNHLGGWYSYRCSKAALNMAIKTISIEWQRTLKHGCVLALHPGTTDTQLSKPFQANLKSGQLQSPGAVADRLLTVIEHASPEQSGSLLSYDGTTLPW